MPIPTGLTGAAGEYYVAAELSRRGWLATVTIKNAPGTDVLAQRSDRRRIVAIQTKTASGGTNFRVTQKDEAQGERDNEWYVLVGLRGEHERPKYYILPRHVLGALTYLQHLDWLHSINLIHGPARPGRQRRDSELRGISSAWVERYRDRWDLLDGPSWDAPYLGEPLFLELELESE
jgi:hypothetical protein